MLLTAEESALNSRGELTIAQLKKIRRKGVTQLIAGIVFLIIVPLSVFMSHIKWGPLLLIWLLSGLFFGGILLWSAKTYLVIKPTGNTIHSLEGAVTLKKSGTKHTIATIAERSFMLMRNESATLTDGKEFTLYYLEDPRMVVGWFPKL